MLIKRLIQQEDIKFINTYTFNPKPSKNIQQKLLEGETDSSAINGQIIRTDQWTDHPDRK